MGQPTIGDNLARLRRFRALTQEQLAAAAGVSVETIRKLEQNERTTARVATLNRLAHALSIRTSELFGASGEPVVRREKPAELGLLPLRQALFPIQGLRGPLARSKAPTTIQELDQGVRLIDGWYHTDDYVSALSALPDLIHRAEATAPDVPAAQTRLAQTYHLAGSVLTQLRAFDLAHRALDQALQAAQRTSDPLVAASIIVTLCWLLMRQGRLDEVERLAVSTAEEIDPSFTRGSAAHLATWGWLMLRGAAAADRNNRPELAADLLDAASAAAMRLGSGDRPGFMPAPGTVGTFSATIVSMKRVESAVIRSDTGAALALAAAVPSTGASTSDNMHRHLLDVAFALADARRPDDAAGILTRLRSTAPAWLRQQRYGREIASSLIGMRRGRLTTELSELATFYGIRR